MNLSIARVLVLDPSPWTAADCRMNVDGSAILVVNPISFGEDVPVSVTMWAADQSAL